MTARDIGHRVLMRRILRALSEIGGHVGVDQPIEPDNSTLASYVDLLADHMEHAINGKGSGLASSVADIDRRFSAVDWPGDPRELIAHLRTELLEIERAIEDLEAHPEDRAHVLMEIGDGMLLLGRLALFFGSTALEPLEMATRKTARRLTIFEGLRAAVTSSLSTRGELWAKAKIMERDQ